MDYLNTKAITNILGISKSALNYRIKIANFPEPDFVEGRSNLWNRETVLNYFEKQKLSLDKQIGVVNQWKQN